MSARLLAAAKVWAFNYAQDEAENVEDCLCGEKQHAEAVELFAAIAEAEACAALAAATAPAVARRVGACPVCQGNEGDAPCAYPSGKMPGCLRDARMQVGAALDRPAVAEQSAIAYLHENPTKTRFCLTRFAKLVTDPHDPRDYTEWTVTPLIAAPQPSTAPAATEEISCYCGGWDDATGRYHQGRCPEADAPQPSAPIAPSFQSRVQPWMMACFGPMIAGDRKERNHRFLEESLELVQSCGCTADEAHQLVDYVFGRPVGEPAQEVGGVMVTLAALCLANGLDMHDAAEVELARIWTKVDAIRAKQAAKPKYGPLPGVAPAPQQNGGA